MHSYCLPAKGRLSGWRDFNRQWDGNRDVWTARSLSEALEKYFWPVAAKQLTPQPTDRRRRRPNADFRSNREQLNELKNSLLKAIQKQNDRLAEDIVYKIFDWGGVSRREDGSSRTWVREQAQKRTLCRELDKAVQLLKREIAPLDSFRTRSLLMNSSMTKVYALADPAQFLIIYDGRVGAALGHLARLFLTQRDERTVPEDLKFRWGGIQPPPSPGRRNPRNPSREQYVFPPLFNVYRSDLRHAEMVRRASFLVSECIRLIKRSSHPVSPRELEAALFMWGYRVN